ncbi:type II toxin-antitoxin system HicA family toxin [Thermophilibacter provencensis]|uniref:type II toxin-antitoxin system HicA family toxin n=1 Tax=Thermophilibacter provencensis TaxID=1852386 RepID=UPI00338FF715
MVKRREVVKLLEIHGFESAGGTNHEKYIHKDGRSTIVPRHREIKELTFRLIMQQSHIHLPRR